MNEKNCINSDMYKASILIPTYNHYEVLYSIVSNIHSMHYDVMIVDDGSNELTKAEIKRIQNDYPNIHCLVLAENNGKGAAIEFGFKELLKLGYTHAFQIDADGQHSLKHIDEFILLSKNNPHCIITGNPQYDSSVPKHRLIGRYMTHIWVWIETLSLRISDSMCGYRVYPLSKTVEIFEKYSIGHRMQFDTNILVRLFWEGTPVIMSPVPVTYPSNNTSNFQALADNWRITKMHTLLIFEMIFHLPKILKNKPDYSTVQLNEHHVSWASLNERGTIFGMLAFIKLCDWLGPRICKSIAYIIVYFYYLSSKTQRQASNQYLSKVLPYTTPFQKNSSTQVYQPKFKDKFKHFMSFYEMALDKILAWSNSPYAPKISHDEMSKIRSLLTQNDGGIMFVSHLGNMDICRAISYQNHKKRLHILLHTKNSKRFNSVLKFFNPDVDLNILEVTEIGPDTIIYLKSCVQNGDWVVIAADRSPISGREHTSDVTFLGEKAPFAHGPYILASILECQVYTVFSVKNGNNHKIYIDLFENKIILKREERLDNIKNYIIKYVEILEKYTVMYPYQWFNFFDFWCSTNNKK